MRKTVQVLGVGQRKAGVGKKSGKRYDFTEVSLGFADDGFAGVKAEVVAIDTAIIGERSIAVGDMLDIVYHQYNFKTQVDAIL